jgi:hypothetical protein
VKVDRGRNLDCRLLQSYNRCVADLAGALLVDILMLVRQQIGSRCDCQQRNCCQSQDNDEFLPAASHLIWRNINRMAPDVANFLCRNGLTKGNRLNQASQAVHSHAAADCPSSVGSHLGTDLQRSLR